MAAQESSSGAFSLLPPDVLLHVASFLSDLAPQPHARPRAYAQRRELQELRYSSAAWGLAFPPFAPPAAARVGGARVSARALARCLRPVCRAWRDAADEHFGAFATLSADALGARSSRSLARGLLSRPRGAAPRFVARGVRAVALTDVSAGALAAVPPERLREALTSAAAAAAGALPLAGGLGGLAALELSNCSAPPAPSHPGVADAVIGCLAAAGGGRALRSLTLRDCPGVGDELLAALGALPAGPLAALASLDLSGSGRRCAPSGTNADGTVNLEREPGPPADALSDAGLLAVLGLEAAGPEPATAADLAPPAMRAPAPPAPPAPPALLSPPRALAASGCWASLSSLRLSACPYVTDAGVAAALLGCPRLVELDVGRCPLLEGRFLAALCAPHVAARMQRLCLSGVGGAAAAAERCLAEAEAAFSGRAAPGAAPPGFPRLVALDLSWCLWMTARVAPHVARALRAARLQTLSLHACTALPGAELRRLAAAVATQHLTALDLGQMPLASDEDVAAFLAAGAGAGAGCGLPLLEQLDVSSSRTSLLTFAAAGAHCPRLEVLRCRVAVRVGAEAVRALVAAARDALEDRRRRELLAGAAEAPEGAGGEDSSSSADTTFDLDSLAASAGLDSPGRAGAPRRAQPPRAPSLRAQRWRFATPAPGLVLGLAELDFWRSMEIDDSALTLIAEHCPRLRRLSVEGCDVALTDAGVVAVAGACPMLEWLSIASCPVSDVSLNAVAAGCPRLEFLDISHGAEFSRAALSNLVRALPRLRALRARRCSGVCNGFLRVLVRACPLLSSLELRSCGQKEDETDFVGIQQLGSAAFWREGRPGPPPDAPGPGPAPTPTPDDASLGERDGRLTGEALAILAGAVRPPGRLAALDVAFVPAITVEALYAFATRECLGARGATCALTTLRAFDGVALPLLTMLVRRVVFDEQPPAVPAGAEADADAAAGAGATAGAAAGEQERRRAGPPPADAARGVAADALAVLENEPLPLRDEAAAPAARPAGGQRHQGLRNQRELALRRLSRSLGGTAVLS